MNASGESFPWLEAVEDENDAPPSLRSLVPSLPAALDTVVARALAKDPDDRHPTAGDLARALHDAVGNAIPPWTPAAPLALSLGELMSAVDRVLRVTKRPTVHDVVPRGFAAYARIFHPAKRSKPAVIGARPRGTRPRPGRARSPPGRRGAGTGRDRRRGRSSRGA